MSIRLPDIMNAIEETKLDPKDHKLVLSHNKDCKALNMDLLDMCTCSPNAVITDRLGNTICYIHATVDGELIVELKRSTWN